MLKVLKQKPQRGCTESNYVKGVKTMRQMNYTESNYVKGVKTKPTKGLY
jgi:hypothetical protein